MKISRIMLGAAFACATAGVQAVLIVLSAASSTAAANLSTEVVVMDDFIYGEPMAAKIPEPSTLLLLMLALAAAASIGARRSTGQGSRDRQPRRDSKERPIGALARLAMWAARRR